MRQEKQTYIDKIISLWPHGEEASAEVLALVEEAVLAFPQCAQFWCMRGYLIQLSPIEANYQLADAVSSYHQAIAVDPLCGEAHESIGYYYDVIEINFALSEEAFRKAVKLGAGQNSYLGLARVLAERGRREEALEILSPDNCPFHDEIDIQIIRDEIVDGRWFFIEANSDSSAPPQSH